MLSAGRLLAQDRPAFSAAVKVVNVFATVRDRRGAIVRDLTKDDFILAEDGRPQLIRYFAQESELPLSVGLLIDTSGSTRWVLPEERLAGYRFLQQVMREGRDLAFIVHFDYETRVLQDVTSQRRLLENALVQLQISLQRRQHPAPGFNPTAGTVLFDAVSQSAFAIMRKQSGRKALIVLSDGVDRGSRQTLGEAVEAVQRSDALLYSILFEDPKHGGRGRGWDKGLHVMRSLAGDTGGRCFDVTGRMPLEKAFSIIEEDLRSQYSLGYTPDAARTGRGYRKIRLTVKGKGLSVRTRKGYYSEL